MYYFLYFSILINIYRFDHHRYHFHLSHYCLLPNLSSSRTILAMTNRPLSASSIHPAFGNLRTISKYIGDGIVRKSLTRRVIRKYRIIKNSVFFLLLIFSIGIFNYNSY